MRASADYRRQVLHNLMQRAWLEQQGHGMVQLGDLP
jgi:xanthine dehydrogenase iron-sulfur cluster and FAD-binding subunit A